MVWSCFKVFWFSKDNPIGHIERKKKKRYIEEELGRQNIKWTLPAELGQLKKGQDGKKFCELIFDAPTNFQGYGIE